MKNTILALILVLATCSVSHADSTVTAEYSADGKALSITMQDNAVDESAARLFNRFLTPADGSGVKAVDIGFFRIACEERTLAKCTFTLVDSDAVILDRGSKTAEIRLFGSPLAAQVRTAFTTTLDFLFLTPDSRITMGGHDQNLSFEYAANP
jgi:hypothetical protein